jgi:hypothetical protein
VAGQINPAATLVSTYNRWDGRIPYTPVPGDLASVTGATRDSRFDPNLKGEYMDEWTAGVDLGLRRDTVVRFNLVRKYDFRGNKELNLAQPFEAFTDFRTGVDPGRDNVTGTADDGVVQVWSVPRSYPTFGQIRTLWVNTVGDEGNDRYTALEATLNKQYADGWSFMASYVWDRRIVRNIEPRTPNEAAYNWQLPERYQSVRLNGTYELPWKLMIAATFTGQEGEYYNRIVQVRDALNTLVNVVVEGQAGRYDWVKLADARLSKTFSWGKSQSLEAFVDVFNLTNSSVVLRRVTTNGPNYFKPLSTGGIDAASANPIPAARVFRASLRYRF